MDTDPTTPATPHPGRSIVVQQVPSATQVKNRAAVLPVIEAADRLGVTPARVRALMAHGRLTDGGGGMVLTRQVDDLADRDVVRSLDAAALEGILDKALGRRLPALVAAQLQAVLDEALEPSLDRSLGRGLAAGLAPVSREVATALADIELSTEQRVAAVQRAEVAETALTDAQDRLARLEQDVARVRHENAVLRAQPTGLLRRRRRVEVSAA